MAKQKPHNEGNIPRRRRPKKVILEHGGNGKEKPEDSVADSKEKSRRKSPKKLKKLENNKADRVEGPSSENPIRIDARKTGKRTRIFVAAGFLLVLVVVGVLAVQLGWLAGLEKPKEDQGENCLGIHPAKLNFDFFLSELDCARGIIGMGKSLSDVLLDHNVEWTRIKELKRLVAYHDIPLATSGNPYTVFHSPTDPLDYKAFAYEPDSTHVVLMSLSGKPQARLHPRVLISEKYRQKSILLNTSLAETMFNQEFGLTLTTKMEDILKWKIDFFHLTPGDHFRLLYEEFRYEGGISKLGKIKAIYFRANDKDYYAYHFKNGNVEGYYDEQGRPVITSFLKAPVKYGRISSHYNLYRPDPLDPEHKVRPHLGTDYAAPLGTPIFSVANGQVEKVSFSAGNGNFVKIRHSDVIETQYLHMSRFAQNLKEGDFVRQGEVIGYVGSTGRSTGPHVCFRYWKNGEQVNHLKEEFPSAAPLGGDLGYAYFTTRDSLRSLLDGNN